MHWPYYQSRSARDLIFGTDVDAFYDQVVGQTNAQLKRSKESMRRVQDVWGSRGAIGKLHNLIKAILIGPQRQEALKKIMTGNNEVDNKSFAGGMNKIARMRGVAFWWMPPHSGINYPNKLSMVQG